MYKGQIHIWMQWKEVGGRWLAIERDLLFGNLSPPKMKKCRRYHWLNAFKYETLDKYLHMVIDLVTNFHITFQQRLCHAVWFKIYFVCYGNEPAKTCVSYFSRDIYKDGLIDNGLMSGITWFSYWVQNTHANYQKGKLIYNIIYHSTSYDQ